LIDAFWHPCISVIVELEWSLMNEPPFDHERLTSDRASIESMVFSDRIANTLSEVNRPSHHPQLQAAESSPLNLAPCMASDLGRTRVPLDQTELAGTKFQGQELPMQPFEANLG
jgi:hypothetical protein